MNVSMNPQSNRINGTRMEGGREGGISLTSFYDKSDNDVEISSIDRFSDKEDSRYNFYRVNDLSQIYIYIYTFRRIRGEARY